MLLETIFFGIVLFLGYVVVCAIAGFIFMVAFEILSILVEETYNVIHDFVTLVIRLIKFVIHNMDKRVETK